MKSGFFKSSPCSVASLIITLPFILGVAFGFRSFSSRFIGDFRSRYFLCDLHARVHRFHVLVYFCFSLLFSGGDPGSCEFFPKRETTSNGGVGVDAERMPALFNGFGFI